MENYQKGFSIVALFIIIAIVVIATIGYFAVAQNFWKEDNNNGNFTKAVPFVSARDAYTGIVIDAKYILDNKIYTAVEIDAYLKEVPKGKYYYRVEADGYKAMDSWTVTPVLPGSERIIMSGELPLELANSNLSQFVKPDMGLLVGYVVDENGQPLEGVFVKSPTESTTTSNRGFYALNVVIPLSLSCEGVNVIFSKSGYVTKNYLHAMSGNIAPHTQPMETEGEVLWDTIMKVELSKGSGENIFDEKHKHCY